MNLALKSIAIGTGLALTLFGLGFVAVERGAEPLSYALYWQAWLLQTALPCVVVPGIQGLLCENMAVGKAIFYAGIPLGIALYSLLAYGVLKLLQRRNVRPGGHPPSALA